VSCRALVGSWIHDLMVISTVPHSSPFDRTSLSYLQSCFTHVADMTSRRGCGLLPHIVGTFARSSLYSRQAGVSGATVWNDLPLHVPSAPSLAVFRQRLETFLLFCYYQDTIIWLIRDCYHSSLLSGLSGPCNNWHYLGHVKNVVADDDDHLPSRRFSHSTTWCRHFDDVLLIHSPNVRMLWGIDYEAG